MAILHVRNVPEWLYARLKRRADEQHRSLSSEVITLLEWAVGQAEMAPGLTLTAIRERRTFDPSAAHAPSSTELLREDRGR